MSKLSRYIPKDTLDWVLLVALVGIVLTFAVNLWGWPKWVPWSAEQRLPVVEAQRDLAVDNAMVAGTVADTRRDQSASLQITLNDVRRQETQTNADIQEIQAAPDADARHGAFMRSLCRNPLYADVPECAPYR